MNLPRPGCPGPMISYAMGKFEIPNDFTFWQPMNSQFLATFVGAIVAILVAVYGKKTASAKLLNCVNRLRQ